MARDDVGGAVRVLRRVRRPRRLKRLARIAARGRRAVRRWFPDDERYFEAFSRLRPQNAVAAFHGRQVVGLVLLQRPGRDPFDVDRATFVRLYGLLRGLILFYGYLAVQRLSLGGACYVASVWVSPKFRGAGIGVRMMVAARYRATGRWTVLARRGEAERFFARVGFSPQEGRRARLVAAFRDRSPMEWRPTRRDRRRVRRERRARRLSGQVRQATRRQG